MRIVACVALIATLTIPVVARAQGYDDALATELFNAGRDLMAEGRYREACPKLEESGRLAPKVGTYGKLAECEHQLGHLAVARSNWQRAQNLARVENDERLPIINEELARVDALVPKLRLLLPVELPPELVIRINELSVTASSADIPIPLDPGRYEIRVSAPGKAPWVSSVTLSADGAITQVAVPPLVAADLPKQAPPPVEVRSAAPRWTTFESVGAVSAALGVVALSMGGAYGVVAQSKLDDSNSHGCDGNACTAEGAALRNDARSAGNAATGLFIAGGVMFAGGAALFLLAPNDAEQPLQASASVGPDGFGASLKGAF